MNSRARRIAPIAIVLALLAFVVWNRARHTAGRSTTGEQTAAAATSTGHRSATSENAGDPAHRKAWHVQIGAPGRRIAGKVRSQGAPLVGAKVRLGHEGDELAIAMSGPDGRFDFGEQPAATYTVSAEFLDKTPAAVTVAAADPLAHPDALVLDLEGCRSRLYGSIVDASGGGIARARLTVAGLGGTEASAAGEYSLCVPLGDSVVRIVADGYGALELPMHLVGVLHRDFELVPEAVLGGAVIDEGGKPVPFARIVAFPQAVEGPHFLAAGRAVADADGRFRVENLAPGRFLLAATAEGLGTSTPKPAVATPGTSNDVTLVVAMQARVSGHVMMRGTAVAGAKVSFARPGARGAASYSQADGSFVLDNVPLGNTKVDAGAYQVDKPRELVVDKATIDDVVIEVSELATLRGHVTRKGQPVAGALVATFTGPQRLSARTDDEGAYEIRGLTGGSIHAYAQSFGDAPSFAPVVPVKLAVGTVTEHDFELSGAAMVAGTVVDESGKAVPNVYVRLIDDNGDIGESMTDASGQFTCTSMLGGGDYRPAVFPTPGSRTAFPPATSYAPIHLADGNAFVKNVTIAIKNSRLAIAGRVVDEHGQPVADVHVEAIGRGYGGSAAMLPSVRAAVDGAFTIDNLAPGAYALHAHAGDGSEVEVSDIAAGATGVELRLVRPGSIDGTLVGFATPPRVHARQVTAQLAIGNEAVIDGTRFSITGLTPGTYVVEALGTDESDGQSVTITSGATATVVLKSRGKGTLAGTVVDFTSHTPIAGMACVAAQSVGGQAGDVGPGAASPGNTTDASGKFSIAAPIGRARVMCFPPDAGYSVAGADVDVPASGQGTVSLQAVKAIQPPSDVGFRIKPLTLPLVIASVDSGGPARRAGLLPGDVVVTIDGTSVAGLIPSGAMTLAWNHRPSTTLVLGVLRNGNPLTIKIVAESPQN